MANGYIGKISAVVTANTQDLSRKLQGAVGDVTRFSNSIDRSLRASSASATKSIEQIFTPLQRLQRQLTLARSFNLNLRTDDQIRSIQLLAQATREIAAPLSQAAGQFDRLSTAVAGEFTPALNLAQRQVKTLEGAINRGQTSFSGFANGLAAVRSRAEATAEAISRITEAQAGASSLATGRELRFSNPALVAENARAARLQQQAAALSPSQIEAGGIASLVGQQRQASEEAARLQARLENVRLTRKGDSAEAERALASQIAAYQRLNAQIEAQIAGLNRAANASKAAADNEISLLQRREQGARDAESARAARQDAEVASLINREQQQQRLEQQLAADAKKRQDAEIAALVSREQKQLRLEQQLAADAKKRQDAEIAALITREQQQRRLEQQLAADAKKRQDAEIAALITREQQQQRLEQQLAADAKKRQDAEIAALITREQQQQRLEQQLAADARSRQDAEIAALITREQQQQRLEQQLAADARRRQDAEIAALITREQQQQRLEQQLAADARRRQEDEDAALTRRYQRQRALDQQLAANDPATRVREREDREAIARRLRDEELLSIAGRRTDLGGLLQQRGLERITALTGSTSLDSSDRFGPQAQRDIDALATRVGNVRQQLETLPNSIRTRFIPELQRAQAQLVRLQNAPNATAEAIENAARRVERLEASARRAQAALNFRQSFGGAGLRGIEEGLNQQALQGYNAQLQLLQRTLAGTSQAARGPAVAAFNNLRTAIADAMERGTLETEQTRRQLRLLTTDAVNAVAQVARVNPRALGRQLQRAGDIARGASGNVGLAVQQAIFAVDDFFSVTGGLDQRIRAAGNNISQLAFLLGGTYGLAAGVAITVTGQLAAGFIKWYTEGRTADDVTKALNASLEKQIDLAKQLKDALRGAFDSAIEGGFSSQAREARAFGREVEEIRRKLKEAREEAAVTSNPDVVAARQELNAAQRQVEEAQTPAGFIAARRRLERAQANERAARQRATEIPGIQEVAGVIGNSFALETAARTDFESGTVAFADEIARRRRDSEALIRRAEQRLAAGDEIGSIGAQRAELRARIQELSDPSISGQVEAQQAIVQLQATLDRLDSGLSAAIDRAVVRSLENSFEAGRDIAQTQEQAGRAGATAIQTLIDRANRDRDDAAQRLESARRITDLDRRRQAVESASAGLAEADRKARELANKFGSVILSVQSFSDALDRVSNRLADAVAGDARSRADQARREENRQRGLVDAGLGFPGDADAAQRQRQRVEADAREAEDRRDRVRRQNDVRRELFERDAIAGRAGAEAQQAIRDRDEAQRRLDEAERAGDVTGANAARRDRDRAQSRLDRSFENSPAGRAAAARADELDRADAARREQEASITRGRELGRSPAENAARELTTGLRDLDAAFEESTQAIIDRAGGRPQDARAELDAARADYEEDRRRLIDDSLRAQAPALFALADSVQNAVLQGPSRAALNASDISTAEGARELNRLIRGDDAARDQNLVELQRQTTKLDELIQAVRDNGADVAN